MEIKTRLVIDVEKEGRLYNFSMPAGCPLGEVYDVLYECLSHIANLAKETVEKSLAEGKKKETESGNALVQED